MGESGHGFGLEFMGKFEKKKKKTKIIDYDGS